VNFDVYSGSRGHDVRFELTGFFKGLEHFFCVLEPAGTARYLARF
jgi:hypothetical protein